jgi:hypothetical protein
MRERLVLCYAVWPGQFDVTAAVSQDARQTLEIAVGKTVRLEHVPHAVDDERGLEVGEVREQALYFSDDAVTLENQLYAAFSNRRVNNVNLRREYFFATPHQVRLELAQRVGNLLEFTDIPEATQYNLSRSRWPGASAL